MRLDIDTVPSTPAEAVHAVLDALELADVDEICAPGFNPVDLHHTVGRYLRNAWSLWLRTPLVERYREAFRLGHADDISMLILREVCARVRGEPFDPSRIVSRCHEHWRKMGMNEFGEAAS